MQPIQPDWLSRILISRIPVSDFPFEGKPETFHLRQLSTASSCASEDAPISADS